MPQIAIEGIEQFHTSDRAFRVHYYYLGSLELDPVFLENLKRDKKKRKKKKKSTKDASEETAEDFLREQLNEPIKKCYARTPLEVPTPRFPDYENFARSRENEREHHLYKQIQLFPIQNSV